MALCSLYSFFFFCFFHSAWFWSVSMLCIKLVHFYCWVRAQSLQSCLTVCNFMDGSPPGYSVHGIFQAKILGCHFLLQRIFPSQRLNLHLLPWQEDSLLLSHQRSPLLSTMYIITCLYFQTFAEHLDFWSLGLLQTKLLWIFLYKPLCGYMFSFLLGK